MDRFEVMFIAVYTNRELNLYSFQEIGNSGSYLMQVGELFSLDTLCYSRSDSSRNVSVSPN